jgi:type IV secretory pathway VirB10-like protein
MRLALTTTLRRALPMAALIALAVLVSPVHAQWKWRDKDGQVNASDRPPPKDIPDKDILGRPGTETRRSLPAPAAAPAASAASAPPKTALDREIEARKKASEQERSAKAKAEEEHQAALRGENCRRARGQLAALESGQRIARVNERGEREVLDDKARAGEMRQAREIIASDCR